MTYLYFSLSLSFKLNLEMKLIETDQNWAKQRNNFSLACSILELSNVTHDSNNLTLHVCKCQIFIFLMTLTLLSFFCKYCERPEWHSNQLLCYPFLTLINSYILGWRRRWPWYRFQRSRSNHWPNSFHRRLTQLVSIFNNALNSDDGDGTSLGDSKKGTLNSSMNSTTWCIEDLQFLD